MGGCATKPKVSKEDLDGRPKAPQPQTEPEPEPEPEPEHPNKDTLPTEQGDVHNLNVNEIVDDDQANKRRSLSILFKENEDTKVSTEDEKIAVEETVKEAENPWEATKSNEAIVKQESPKPEEKLSEESKKHESPKQENETVKTETSQAEKPSEESHINEPAKETVKPEVEAEKPTVETRIDEAAEETVKGESEAEKASEETVKGESEAEKASEETMKEEHVEAQRQSNEAIKHKEEPIEASNPSGESQKNDSEAEKTETLIEESINTELAPLPEEKVIEVVPTHAESVEKVTKEEKSHIVVEDQDAPNKSE